MMDHKHLRLCGLLGSAVTLLLSACSSDDAVQAVGNDAGLYDVGLPESAIANRPAAPSGLVVTAASKSSISLAWTASSSADVTSYSVERAALGTSVFAPVATGLAANAMSFTDSSISQYVAYTYRVLAVNVDGPSEPSNEDTAGPPPSKLQAATTNPTDQGKVYRFGTHTSLALDDNDDPMMAFDGEFSASGTGDTDLAFFVRWDRVNYRWKTPVKVDSMGDINGDAPSRQVSLARGGTDQSLAIAYPRGYYQMWLATSEDGGATWRPERIDIPDNDNNYETSNPNVAMAGQVTHVTYYHGCIKAAQGQFICSSPEDSSGIVYLVRSGKSGAFASSVSPSLPGTHDALGTNDLAIDSSGNPGVALFLPPLFGAAEAYNRTLAFWRPGQAVVKVNDTNNFQNDTPSLSLAFDGTNPRIAYHMQRTADQTHDMWFSSSRDTGDTWDVPVAIPKAHALSSTSWYQSLAIDSKGNAEVAAYFSGASGFASGGPKLFRADTPSYSSWTGGSPDETLLSGFAGQFVDIRYAGNDKISMAFFYDGSAPNLGPGIVFWRQP